MDECPFNGAGFWRTRNLGGRVNDSGWIADWGIVHATDAQRAEAFLRTKGLWREQVK